MTTETNIWDFSKWIARAVEGAVKKFGEGSEALARELGRLAYIAKVFIRLTEEGEKR